jgi:hypothetical protein
MTQAVGLGFVRSPLWGLATDNPSHVVRASRTLYRSRPWVTGASNNR